MKPVILSSLCVLFLILLWGGFCYASETVLADFSQQLSGPVYTHITEENWTAAENTTKQISEDWEKYKTLFYMLSNHTVMRETDISLARLREFIRNEEASDAHAEIAALNELFLSIRQIEAFSVDNIL